MERKNNPAKPLDTCSRLFNFLFQNFPSYKFKQISPGHRDDASPSTVEKRESQVQVVVEQNGQPQLAPPTVVPVEHHQKTIEKTSAEREDSRTAKDQEVGAPLAKPPKNSATIKDSSKKQPSIGVKGSGGEGAATEYSGKQILIGPRAERPVQGPAPDINESASRFIKIRKDSFARGEGI